jgi:hypothetical protein
MNKKWIAALLVGSAICGSAFAEDVEKQEWHFSPYFWLPSMDVTSTVGPVSVPINMGFDELFDTFDVFAISARGEYWWGQFGVVADGLWMDMKADGLGPMGNADVQLSDGIVDVLAAYRFNLKGGGPDVPSMRLLAGGRYHYFKQEISGPVSVGGSQDWVEPVLGAQLLAPMGQKWLATARGDVGGFGVADASDITWSAMAGVGYEFARNWMAKVGYRYYYIDYSTGSGLNTFGIEGSMHGPWIGVAYGR